MINDELKEHRRRMKMERLLAALEAHIVLDDQEERSVTLHFSTREEAVEFVNSIIGVVD
jgi:hypothetical protein